MRAEEAAALRACGTVIARHADERDACWKPSGRSTRVGPGIGSGWTSEGNLPLVDEVPTVIEVRDAARTCSRCKLPLAARSHARCGAHVARREHSDPDEARCLRTPGANAGPMRLAQDAGVMAALVRLPRAHPDAAGRTDHLSSTPPSRTSATAVGRGQRVDVRRASAGRGGGGAGDRRHLTPLEANGTSSAPRTDARRARRWDEAVLERRRGDHARLSLCVTAPRETSQSAKGSVDTRFRAAAMAPSFKCIEGRAGESDALEAARTKADFRNRS